MGFSDVYAVPATACVVCVGTFEMRVYKDAASASDVVAMVARLRHGAPALRRLARERVAGPLPPASSARTLLRVQDACMTSEVFGSLKCDCRQQLDYSLEQLQLAAASAYDAYIASGATAVSAFPGDRIVGVVVYLPQEGRGIGLGQKVAAYALQEDDLPSDAHAAPLTPGLDTVDANRALGLPDDTRVYDAVPPVLADLGLLVASAAAGAAGEDLGSRASTEAMSSERRWRLALGCEPITLLTNNPRKLELLTALGVPLAGRLGCHLPPLSPQSLRYLQSKVLRMGHDIPEHVLRFPPLAAAQPASE
jgi:GTP cyclohydrolase II